MTTVQQRCCLCLPYTGDSYLPGDSYLSGTERFVGSLLPYGERTYKPNSRLGITIAAQPVYLLLVDKGFIGKRMVLRVSSPVQRFAAVLSGSPLTLRVPNEGVFQNLQGTAECVRGLNRWRCPSLRHIGASGCLGTSANAGPAPLNSQ